MQPVYQTTMHTTQPPPPTLYNQRPAVSKPAWPESVKEYVRRSFEKINVVADIPKHEMEAKLKQVITQAAESDQLLSIDWANYPLPQQIIQQEKFYSAHSYNHQSAFTSTNPSLNLNQELSPGSKKRKLQESLNSESSNSLPPWRAKASPNVEQFPGKRVKQGASHEISSKFEEDLEKRRRRFDNKKPSDTSVHHSYRPDDSFPQTSGPVIGTNETLEKSYFRLTRAPRPHEVRPQHILEQSLESVKKKWRKESNYVYVCDQLKAIRQDLVVQRIVNSFTVSVYELHARIALEKGDLGEYNQCQTQLRGFYSQKLGGHPAEFLAYRILYLIHTANRIELNTVLAELTPVDKKEKAVAHALDTRAAVASGNYHRLFKLYLDPPNMGAYLMDMFIERERLLAITKICTGYKAIPVNIRFVTEELGFETHTESAQFILDHAGRECLEEKDDTLLVKCSVALDFFKSKAQAAFKRVDIKGQI